MNVYPILLVPVGLRFIVDAERHTVAAVDAAKTWAEQRADITLSRLPAYLMQGHTHLSVDDVPDEARDLWSQVMRNCGGHRQLVPLSDFVIDLRVSVCMDVNRTLPGPFFMSKGDYTITVPFKG